MKIITNADDFGYTPGVNRAIIDLAEAGVLTSTTVMVNLPEAGQADQLLKFEGFSLGLHFNLTEGPSVSDPARVPGLVDKDGCFRNKKALERGLKEGKIPVAEVLRELRSQFERLREILGERIDHFDSHQGLNRIPGVHQAVMEFGRERKIKALRVYAKYYLKAGSQGYAIDAPGIRSMKRFGLRQVLVQLLHQQRIRKLRGYYHTPDGMLMTKSQRPIDVFKMLADPNAARIKSDLVVEVPFHPAADTLGLVNTKLVEERVEEYQFLMSEPFRSAAKELNLVNYDAAHRG